MTATTFPLTRTEGQGPTYAVSFLASGRTSDPDCSRSSHRLSVALGILADMGCKPVTTHSARMIPGNWYQPEGRHACGFDAKTGTECKTEWTAPTSTADLLAAWDLACEYVRESTAARR